jgi:hypothetical protein
LSGEAVYVRPIFRYFTPENAHYTCFAAVHAAAAAEPFTALEIHDCDHIDEFFSVVTGWPKPIIENGFMTVSDAPGLGHDYDLEGLRKWLKQPGFFEPATEWDHHVCRHDVAPPPSPRRPEYPPGCSTASWSGRPRRAAGSTPVSVKRTPV